MGEVGQQISEQEKSPNIGQVIDIIKQRFGPRVMTGADICAQHGHTLTWIPNQPPDAVFYPENTAEVSEIVKLCTEQRVPLIPFGAGTSLEGHLNAPQGGISIDFAKMNQVLAVHNEDLSCVVQPGVTRKQLNSYIRDTGLFFPIDPGADASIGGMAATRASGTNAVRYGTMAENILNLTAVMSDGKIVKTAQRAKKSAAGYDLTHLLIGSEGTLGVITELTVKLYGRPEQIIAGICPFKSIEDACNTVINTIQMGLTPARIELLDSLQVKACNNYSGLTLEETPTLFLEFHGTELSAPEEAETFSALAEENNGGPLQWEKDPEKREKLWSARHDAAYAQMGLRPGARIFVTDVCVPISRLAECVGETHSDIERRGLIAPIVGHVGDGNFHVGVMIDMDNPKEVEEVHGFLDDLVERALRMEGTCTGEHGVGTGKMGYLRKEHGPGIDVMVAIKKALDPNNIFNPGKIFALK